MTLKELQAAWVDEPQYHVHINDLFTQLVNQDEQLCAHRNFVEANVYGMGERSFQWFWKLMVDEMPNRFKFLEIGVHKGQVVSLIKLLADRLDKSAIVFGITPMNGDGTGWTEDDYESDIKRLHDEFGLDQPILFKGYSQSDASLKFAYEGGGCIFWWSHSYNIIYIDGSHTFDDCLSDLVNYSPMVKVGGYLVIDDSNNDLSFPPTGYFTGIQSVTDAKIEWIKQYGSDWEFVFSVVHISCFRKK